MGNEHFCNCKNSEVITESNIFEQKGNVRVANMRNHLNNINNLNEQCNSNSNDNSDITKPASKTSLFFSQTNPQHTLTQITKKNAINKIIHAYRQFKASIRIIRKSKPPQHRQLISPSTNTTNTHPPDTSLLKDIRSALPKSYNGETSNSHKHGFGIQTWTGGAKYTGTFQNDKAEGFGRFLANGDTYEGEFHLDGATGYGIYSHLSGATYEGYWLNDVQQPIGIETWKDTSCYKGEYMNGKKNGIGMYIWPDGSKYEGEWVDNALNGYGVYSFSMNRVYVGEWRNNMKDGFGEFVWSEKKYLGYYRKDKKDGFGIYYWEKDCKAFIGFWKEGKQNGFGKFMTKTKTKYGVWKGEEIKWFGNNAEAFDYLKENADDKYKKVFGFTMDELNGFFVNGDIYNVI